MIRIIYFDQGRVWHSFFIRGGVPFKILPHILESLSPLCDAIHLLQDGRIYKSYHPVEYPLLADKLREDAAAKYDAALSRVFAE